MNRCVQTLPVLLLLGCAAVAAQDKPVPTAVWVPKPTTLPGYTPPQRPWVKLADLRAAHRADPRSPAGARQYTLSPVTVGVARVPSPRSCLNPSANGVLHTSFPSFSTRHHTHSLPSFFPDP